MLVPAVLFSQVVLAIHVVFVVAAFGALVSYPVIAMAAERLDRRSVPLLHRTRKVVGRSLVNPGMLIVVVAAFIWRLTFISGTSSSFSGVWAR